MDFYSLPRHWEVIDEFEYANGKRELVRPIDHNLVVNSCSTGIATLMKGEVGFGGIKYWAIGSGDSSWGEDAQPAPIETRSILVNETYRKFIPSANIFYIDAQNNRIVNRTNRLEIELTFLENEANGKLREFALFMGDATLAANSGIMLNHKTHKLIEKTPEVKLVRKIRLTF